MGILFSYSQTSYYVSKSGNDSNNGTSLNTSFLTIGKAISVISAGDKIYIRHGVYHEDLTLNNLDATSSNKTLISNYNDEKVIIDGTIPISNTWLDDKIGSTPIKKIESFTSTITQLFVGNNQMVMARWPNAQFSDLSIYDHDNWAEGVETGSSDGSIIIDETVENPESLDLTNSIGVLNLGSFKTYNRTINSHTQQAGNDIFTYSSQIGSGFKTKHYYFFFEGKKEFIDTKNEWFLDNSNDILYLNPPTGVDLTKVPIRGKVRDYSISISGSEYLKIKGLTFFATTLKAQGSSNLEIESCNFYYPSNSQRMLGSLAGANVTTLGTGSGNSARVDSSTVSGCLFIDSEGEALVVYGDDNTIKNSYFRNIDWSATELNGLMVSVYVNGNNNKFNNNEIYNTGASATVWPGTASEFSYNIVSSTGHAQSDGSVFQGTSACVAGSEVHHNFVYDTEKYAFRYDAPGGDASQAGSFGKMHHNIADNTLGLMIKGNNQIIAHNTVLNTINNRNDIIILSEDCSNNSTWFYNNLAERIGAHRSDATFSAPGTSPMPIGGVGYIKNGNNWEFCDSGDSFYSGTGTGSSTSNYDGINVSRPGITYDSNIESLISYNAGNGKSMADYVPTSNKLLDQGASPTNVVSTSLSTTATLNTIVPQTVSGSAIDIGSLESGALWTPGIDGWTPNQTIDLMSIFALESSIVTNSLILHFDPSNTFCYSGQGNTIYDLSQNDNNGSLNGTTLTNTKGGEIYFDGSDDYIQLGSPFSNNQHTIEFWIYNESDGGNWVWDARDSLDDGYILFYYDSNPQYDVGNDDNSNYSGTHSNLWRHVVATKDGSQTKLYVNGNLKHTVASSYTINTTTNARIGARSFDPLTGFFKGKIAVTRFYSRSLSAEEITQNFDADKARFGVAPFDITLSQFDKSGLSLYLDGANPDSYSGSGNTWYDLSGNGNNFTVYGSPLFNDEMKGGTFVFDENNDYAKSVTSTVLNRNEYTKLAIFYPKSTTKNIISGGNDAAHAFYMRSSNNKITAGHNSTWNRVGYTLPSGNMLDKWNFGAVSFSNSSGWKLYYNGSLVDSDNNTDVSNGSGLVRIAAHGDGANLFDGRIPVALIFDRVLSASEIENIYNHFAPRYNLSYSTATVTIDEFSAAGIEVGVLAGVDSDTQYNDFSYSLVGGDGTNDRDNSSFTISGTQLLLNNSNISYDNTQQLKIYVQITDGPYTLNKAFVINVNNINITPIDIGLTSNTIAENLPFGSVVGTLSGVDSDTSISSLTFTLASSGDSRDDDNASFSISGTTLLTSTTLDYETKNSYNIYINVNDGTSDFAKAFNVSVTSVPEIERTQIALNNSTVSVTFSAAAFGGSSNATSTLQTSDFVFSLSGGVASLSSNTPSSISISGTIIGLGISLSGTPNGNEILTISPASNAVFGNTGNTVSTSQTSNTTKLIPNIEKNGLVLYVDSRNQSSYPGYGTTLYDISGNNHDFTINGSMDYNTTDGFTFVSGQTSKYFKKSNFPHPANTFTSELFIKTSQTSNGGIISYNKVDNDNANLLYISSSNGGNIRTHTIGTVKDTDANISDNQWHHFVHTVDKSSGEEKIYIDGVLIQTFASNNTSIPVNGCLALGQDYDTSCGGFSTNDAFGGFLPVFRLYNKVLTENEIMRNYNTLFSSSPKIKRTQIAVDNSIVSVTFDELVFNTNSGSGTLEVSDFSLSLSGGNAVLSSSNPSSISVDGSTIGLGIPLIGTPNGNEVLTISPLPNSIFDIVGDTASTTQTSNTTKLIPNIERSGLVLYVDSRNQSSYPGYGTTLYDISGNNNDFTIYGTMNYSTTNGFTFVSGQTSKYFEQSNFPHPPNTFTSELFIKTSQTSNGGIISYNKVDNDNANLLYIWASNGGNIRTHTRGTTKDTDANISDNQWHHFVHTVDKSSGEEKIYIDGVLIQTFASNNTSIPVNGCLALGQDHDTSCGGFSTSDAFGGFLPVFRLYNKVLTQSEITQNYNTLVSPPLITSTTLASDNSVVSVTFSEAVFDTNSGSGALEVGDFSLTINGGTATLTSSAPSSISSQGNTYGLGIPLSGNANGSEVLTVAPVVNSIYDANAAVASTTQTSNTINLYGDSDGDGVNDPVDLCPNTPNGESVDADGCAESQKDPDNDGVTGVNDNCPAAYNPSQTDTDGDGIGDACDPDDDNDGIADGSDNCPLDSNPNQVDTDSDNIGNLCDSDDDNDGYEDQRDAFPLDPSEWDDTDSDGIGNNADPNDDNDQCLDEDDAFPLDRTECLDTDGDEIGNNADPDDDNDGYEDQKDAFPLDPNEWIDTDGDGVGNNTDTDDDGDGYLDEDEIACGSDPLRTGGSGLPKDYDQDFIPDCVDPDDDNDGCLDQEDAFPLNERECKDSDGDGVGDESDFDDDNDGVWDDQDAFPLDPNETTDTDGDGIGDNVDTDKNNDGFPDDKIEVSQVLTPGQPGMEATWKIINLDRYPSANVKVYAPSGILVFTSWDYRNNWNGVDIHTGEELPTGPYYYLVDKGDGSDVLSGWLYIFTDK